jgi:ABC-type polysaccharide/polyol phosphate export permease
MEYGLKQYIFVIRELTAREIKRKYSRSVLGIVWSVLHPLMFMIIMSIVFSGVATTQTTYPVYYITGYTIWTMFNVATTTSMTSFEDNKNLFQKTKMPREVLVLSRDYTAFVNLGCSTIALALVLVIYRIKLDWTILFFFLAVIMEGIFTVGVSFLLATIYVFFKDIKFIWKNILIFIVHMIAIYIPIERYPKAVWGFTQNNPLFIYPDVARKCILEKSYDIRQIKLMFIWSAISLLLGFSFFKLMENNIVKKL